MRGSFPREQYYRQRCPFHFDFGTLTISFFSWQLLFLSLSLSFFRDRVICLRTSIDLNDNEEAKGIFVYLFFFPNEEKRIKTNRFWSLFSTFSTLWFYNESGCAGWPKTWPYLSQKVTFIVNQWIILHPSQRQCLHLHTHAKLISIYELICLSAYSKMKSYREYVIVFEKKGTTWAFSHWST